MAFCGYLKQSTAVDILLGPCIDDTDGKTAETGLTLDVEISMNGQALANKTDATTPVHDAAGTVDGYYNCELDATDTGTLGIITVVAHAAGFLPVRHDYQVVTANWYDTMCSTDQFDVNVTNVAGTGQTGNDNGADINAILTDTNELQTDWTNGGRLDLIVDAIVADTNELQGDWTNAGRLDAILDELTTQGDTNETKIDTIDTNVDSILADTGTDGVVVASINNNAITAAAIATDAIDADALKADAVDEILDEEVDNDGTAISLRGAMKLILSRLTGLATGGGTTSITFRDLGDSKNRIVMTVDEDGDRSAVTLDAS